MERQKSLAPEGEAETSELARLKEQMMNSCRLPDQNEMWFRRKFRPLWQSVLSASAIEGSTRERVEKLLDALYRSFHVGQDESLIEKVTAVPKEVRERWIQLAYREISGNENGAIGQCIDFLKELNVDVPRKRYSLNNLLCLKPLVELVPKIEKTLNDRLAQLKNSS